MAARLIVRIGKGFFKRDNPCQGGVSKKRMPKIRENDFPGLYKLDPRP